MEGHRSTFQARDGEDGALPHVDGFVTVDDAPDKRTFMRFCRKRIERWLREHAATVGEADFRVSLSREAKAGRVSCETEISVGRQKWRGFDLAPDMQSAFIHSMKRLQPH